MHFGKTTHAINVGASVLVVELVPFENRQPLLLERRLWGLEVAMLLVVLQYIVVPLKATSIRVARV